MAETEEIKIWLSKVQLENFKSIKNAEVSFCPGLNIIIGKNGTGKTNLLQFINSYSSINSILNRRNKTNVKYSLDYEGYDKVGKHLIFQIHREKKLRQDKDEIESVIAANFKITSNGETDFEHSIELEEKATPEKRNELLKIRNIFNNLVDIGCRFIRYTLPNVNELGMVASSDKFVYNKETGFESLGGSFLDFIIDFEISLEKYLLKNYDVGESNLDQLKTLIIDKFYDVSHNINLITPIRNYTKIEDIRLNPNINVYEQENKILIENLVIDFRVENSWIPWSFLSDGTKRLFYLIVETSLLEKSIILIDEPELGIHPSQLYQLMDYLKNRSHTNQVIVTTHSPLVLDILGKSELTKIIIAKSINSETKFDKLSSAKIDKAKRYMENIGSLSYYWLHSDLEEDD